jgi:hypothetical protein
MDTLVIVRKIREAEALAEKGQHGDARKLLEPMLARPDLTPAHKELIHRKIEVFEKQKERATRMVSRRASLPPAPGESSDDTDLGSGRRPSSGDTTVERPAVALGAPTEALARPPVEEPKTDRDTTKLRKKPEVEKPKGDTTLADKDLVSIYEQGDAAAKDRPPSNRNLPSPSSERRAPPRGSDTDIPSRASQSDRRRPAEQRTVERPAQRELELRAPTTGDLAPLAPSEEISVIHDDTAEIAKVQMDAAPTLAELPPGAPTVAMPAPPELADLVKKAAESRAKRIGTDFATADGEKPDAPALSPESKGMFKALSLDAPSVNASPPSVRVQDSLISGLAPAAPAPPKASNRSSKDLTSLVERLPENDMTKELALEVVRLREELDRAKSGTRRDTDKTGVGSSRRIAPGEKPESSIFRIPSNRVNTIVRTAAGTADITAHMPTRDEDVPELHVLRRESVKKQPETESRSARLNLAQDYIDASQVPRAKPLAALATLLGILVIVTLLVWAVYWGISAAAATENPPHNDSSPSRG